MFVTLIANDFTQTLSLEYVIKQQKNEFKQTSFFGTFGVVFLYFDNFGFCFKENTFSGFLSVVIMTLTAA